MSGYLFSLLNFDLFFASLLQEPVQISGSADRWIGSKYHILLLTDFFASTKHFLARFTELVKGTFYHIQCSYLNFVFTKWIQPVIRYRAVMQRNMCPVLKQYWQVVCSFIGNKADFFCKQKRIMTEVWCYFFKSSRTISTFNLSTTTTQNLRPFVLSHQNIFPFHLFISYAFLFTPFPLSERPKEDNNGFTPIFLALILGLRHVFLPHE